MTKVKIDWRILSLFDIASTILQIDVPITPMLSAVPITATSLKEIWIIYVKAAIVSYLKTILSLFPFLFLYIYFDSFPHAFTPTVPLCYRLTGARYTEQTRHLRCKFNATVYIIYLKCYQFGSFCFILQIFLLLKRMFCTWKLYSNMIFQLVLRKQKN